MLVDVDTTTITTTTPNNISNSHRRVTSYDHFGTMSSGWLAGMGISSQPVAVAGGGGGGQHGLLPSSTSGGTIGSSNCMNNLGHHNHNHNHAQTSIDSHSSMNLNSIGLSISQMNFNDATQTPTPTGGVLSAASTSPAVTSPAPFHLHGKSNTFSSAGKSIIGINSSGTMPKLMLLTVADPPKIACELQVHYNELHRVIPWLTGTTADDDTMYMSSSLDGVYLQYEKEMMTPEGAAYLRQLSKQYLIGIWGYADIDPDDFETFEWLVKEGNCSFVNTDLPKHFLKR